MNGASASEFGVFWGTTHKAVGPKNWGRIVVLYILNRAYRNLYHPH